MKKKIVLAGMWPRIAAHGIDLGSILLLAIPLYFAAVLPSSFDSEKVKANNEAIYNSQIASGLYADFGEKAFSTLYYAHTVRTVDELTKSQATVDGIITTVYILDGLHSYYTENRANYFTDKDNLSEEVFLSDVLKLGTSISNIASFSIREGDTHYSITCIEESKASVSVAYVKAAFEFAVKELNSCDAIAPLDRENNQAQLFALWMLAPTVAGCALIFTFFIPLFMPYGKTLGKLAMKLIVLNGAGYEIKKWQLLPRSLSYIALELVGGVLSFGSTFLISYTMTMFTKKHRSFHDLIGYTVVADERRSFWFKDRLDEEEWNNEHPDEGQTEE